ncbi:hypothetical protein RJ639_029962 [Escallonia herrerae]|uniref:Uncharacterized protein n=1 Tax=Escallonia herrerae TaxID=1293975 RepID=A0AA89BNH5_9ASTE|nr:hypothetical protein RJ639_029962 [Escallonia herrerae]
MASPLSSSTALKHPYPDEVNIRILVPIELSPKNPFLWRTLMLDVIENEGLLGFIYGTTVAPPERTTVPDDSSVTGTMETENQDYKDWNKTDQLLRQWFLSTMEAQVRLQFQDIFKEAAVKNLSHYLPLHRAALEGDWESAGKFIEEEPDSVRTIIGGNCETALMVAVRSGRRKHFLKKLLQLMLPADLVLADGQGFTALHIAAVVGDVEVAKVLVQKNPDLPDIANIEKSKPLLTAALHGQRNMFLYLITVTKEDVEPKPFEVQSGRQLLETLLIRLSSQMTGREPAKIPAIAGIGGSGVWPLSWIATCAFILIPMVKVTGAFAEATILLYPYFSAILR